MANFTKNVFIGQRIKIDNHKFQNNKFENCVLVYGGGALNFSNNSLVGVRWEFVDDAARTLGLLSSFYQSGGESKQFIKSLLATFGKQVETPKPENPVEAKEVE